MSAPRWHRRASCLNAGQRTFFEHVLGDKGEVCTNRDGTRRLDKVREDFCAKCPVRRDCLKAAVLEECGAAASNRFGISGGLTPLQRYSIEKRGTLSCPECDSVFDPFGHLEGWLVCDECGFELTTEPLPELGDGWMERHTDLAKVIVAWWIDQVPAGSHGPGPSSLAMILKARPADTKRVYEALVQDGTLVVQNEVYARTRKGLIATWQPPHLAHRQEAC